MGKSGKNSKHSKTKKTSGPETVELEQINIIMQIPKEAVSLEITAQMIGPDGKLMKVKKMLSILEIQEAREDFLSNVEDGDDYDVRYVITDEGRAWLEH